MGLYSFELKDKDINEGLKKELYKYYGFRIDYIIDIEKILKSSLININNDILDFSELVDWFDNILIDNIYKDFEKYLFSNRLFEDLYKFNENVKFIINDRINIIISYQNERNRYNPFYSGIGIDDIYDSKNYKIEFFEIYKKLFG